MSKKKTRHIGGSLLPSHDARILQPIASGRAVLTVITMEALDTHHLDATIDGEKFTLAAHPNGYSCHCLAERIASGRRQAAKEQADYIVRCGGSANWEAIARCFPPETTEQ